MADSSAPDTIVLIHGFWVTPRSWEQWIPYYEAKGYKVIAPAYPGFEAEVEAINADPSVVAQLTVPAIVEHLSNVVKSCEKSPILTGHSAGGTFTQLLLDRGLGAVGVTICSAPTEGVRSTPLSQLKAVFPVFKNPANRHRAVGYTAAQWKFAFGNTFSEEESLRLYQRYHVPAAGAILFGNALANFQPGHQSSWVNYENETRAPLLFISASEDNIMPPKIQASNAKKYKAKGTITEVKLYEGMGHLVPAEPGWEEVADYALSWAESHVATPA